MVAPPSDRHHPRRRAGGPASTRCSRPTSAESAHGAAGQSGRFPSADPPGRCAQESDQVAQVVGMKVRMSRSTPDRSRHRPPHHRHQIQGSTSAVRGPADERNSARAARRPRLRVAGKDVTVVNSSGGGTGYVTQRHPSIVLAQGADVTGLRCPDGPDVSQMVNASPRGGASDTHSGRGLGSRSCCATASEHGAIESRPRRLEASRFRREEVTHVIESLAMAIHLGGMGRQHHTALREMRTDRRPALGRLKSQRDDVGIGVAAGCRPSERWHRPRGCAGCGAKVRPVRWTLTRRMNHGFEAAR
jgi:hypothetical protein